VKKEGQTYVAGETNSARLRRSTYFLKENKPILNALLKDIRKHLQDGGGVLAKSPAGGEGEE